jgi:hypothetical protein
MDIPSTVLQDFPRLNVLTARQRSQWTPEYNCIAFAVGDTTRRWWPNNDDSYWPPGAPDEETIAAFIAAYGALGYSQCDNGDLEIGFEKIAIYADAAGVPTHSAHQLRDGKWESKLGMCVDIQHDSLFELTGERYGNVACYLKRPLHAA